MGKLVFFGICAGRESVEIAGSVEGGGTGLLLDGSILVVEYQSISGGRLHGVLR